MPGVCSSVAERVFCVNEGCRPASVVSVRVRVLPLALCRFVVRIPPVVSMTRDEVIDWVGPTIQRYLGLPQSDRE